MCGVRIQQTDAENETLSTAEASGNLQRVSATIDIFCFFTIQLIGLKLEILNKYSILLPFHEIVLHFRKINTMWDSDRGNCG